MRDLGSRNGTSCAGAAVPPGVDVPVRVGDTLRFGGDLDAWTLVDDAAPVAWATNGSERVEARDGVLLLPGDRVVRFDPRAGWVVEDSEHIPVDDGGVVEVDGVTWSLHLPAGPPPTRVASTRPDLAVVLRVMGDQVQAEIQGGGHSHVFRPRAHHPLLLTLARERLRARRRGVPEAEAGWVALPDLVTHLGITANVGYVWWYRLREQLDQHALGALVERAFTGEIRLADVPVEIVGG